ncbi:hypothetical protein ACIQ1J_29515 [Streptomyces sp. NPDC097107]|uniref:hypothetical protein n=1 Tax=Streptomyces sp. NPDC097107 TaxID=3366089 RepID=UPI0037F7F6D3
MTVGLPDPEPAPREASYAFRYRLPEEFVKVSAPDTAEGWATAMAELMPAATNDERDQAAAEMNRCLPWLIDSGETPVDIALCTGIEEVDGAARLSLGLLIVTVRPSNHRDQLLSAEGIYRAKGKRFFAKESQIEDLDFPLGKGFQGRQDSLLAAKLPCGPGVMSVSLRSVEARIPRGAAHLPNASSTKRIPMAVLQLIIPAPNDYCVYITISTPSVYLLNSYCGRLAHIGRTFRFDRTD